MLGGKGGVRGDDRSGENSPVLDTRSRETQARGLVQSPTFPPSTHQLRPLARAFWRVISLASARASLPHTRTPDPFSLFRFRVYGFASNSAVYSVLPVLLVQMFSPQLRLALRSLARQPA